MAGHSLGGESGNIFEYAVTTLSIEPKFLQIIGTVSHSRETEATAHLCQKVFGVIRISGTPLVFCMGTKQKTRAMERNLRLRH